MDQEEIAALITGLDFESEKNEFIEWDSVNDLIFEKV